MEYLSYVALTLRWLMLASGLVLGASIFLSDFLSIYRNPVAIDFLKGKLLGLSGGLLLLKLFSEVGIRSWLQYQAFAAGAPGQYLLPPHEPISYFLGYITFHFVLWRILGLAFGALVFAGLMVRWPKSAALQQRLNVPEIYLLSFGIAAAGWPQLLVFLAATAIFYVTILIVLTAISFVKRSPQMPRFPLAIPLMLALLPALPFGNPILIALNLDFLRISLFSF